MLGTQSSRGRRLSASQAVARQPALLAEARLTGVGAGVPMGDAEAISVRLRAGAVLLSPVLPAPAFAADVAPEVGAAPTFDAPLTFEAFATFGVASALPDFPALATFSAFSALAAFVGLASLAAFSAFNAFIGFAVAPPLPALASEGRLAVFGGVFAAASSRSMVCLSPAITGAARSSAK